MPIDRALHVAKLRELVDEHGGPKSLADAIARGVRAPDKPIAQTQISNALSGHRPFGESVRRKIERALKLPALWFEDGDSPTGSKRGTIGKQLSQGARWVGAVFDRVPESHQDLIRGMCALYCQEWAPELLDLMPRPKNKQEAEPHAQIRPREPARSSRAARKASQSHD